LYYLSAALHGSKIATGDLPGLREDHHALLESGDSRVERYALVNAETDRITNSLNTLAQEVLEWVGAPHQLVRPQAVSASTPLDSSREGR
jgi:hypothetical protein